MTGELFSIIAPVLISAAIGYGWARLDRPFPTDMVRALIFNIGTPCLVFATLTRIDVDVGTVGAMVGAAVIALAVGAVVAGVILKATRQSMRAFMPAMIFPNAGNMGLPLCLFAFGETGLVLAIAFYLVSSVGQFTVGMAIASGSMRLGLLARNPILYALAAALLFMVTDTPAPAWLGNSTRLLGGVTIPLLLITLGNSLASLRVHDLWRSVGLALLRLVMGFAVGVAVAEILGFTGAARGVLILESAMPVAVFSYLFARQYETEPEAVAGTIIVSTTLSFVSLPFLLWYVL